MGDPASDSPFDEEFADEVDDGVPEDATDVDEENIVILKKTELGEDDDLLEDDVGDEALAEDGPEEEANIGDEDMADSDMMAEADAPSEAPMVEPAAMSTGAFTISSPQMAHDDLTTRLLLLLSLLGKVLRTVSTFPETKHATLAKSVPLTDRHSMPLKIHVPERGLQVVNADGASEVRMFRITAREENLPIAAPQDGGAMQGAAVLFLGKRVKKLLATQ